MMGDIQEFFVHNQVQNFYSVSISGYHIAEAGANPISQLAFTLVQRLHLRRSLSGARHAHRRFRAQPVFFFSNGMDPEYSVIGRVARRIWAVAMKNKYGANERSQKLKYHIQTSGRSLHAQEMDFNDIRTTLQALIAIYDNCNSLHTNAYDEAITTPTEESVRRAMAIQLIINREWGLAKNENPNQGAFIIDELTDLVEEAVLKEFEAIARAAACSAPWKPATSAARSRKSRSTTSTRSTTAPTRSSASIPSSTRRAWRSRRSNWRARPRKKSSRSSSACRLPRPQRRQRPSHAGQAQADGDRGRQRLRGAGRCGAYCSLGQITTALYEVGGQYRRSMCQRRRS
jgi:methylmalonyl-CoA mutase